jgi:predicted secreted protein
MIRAISLCFLFFLLSGLFETVPLKGMFLTGSLGCSKAETSELSLRKSDSGREIAINLGDIVVIELERSGSTGYEWYVDESYKEHFELIREDTETSNGRGLVGTPVVRKWVLKAITKGKTEIKLYLYRDWEGKNKSVDRFSLEVEIR